MGNCVVLSAAGAAVTGKGVSFERKIIPTAYDEATGTVANVGAKTTVTYTVPQGVDGVYDVYLTVSKCLASGSSAPFGFSVNGGPVYAFPLAYQVAGNSPFAYHKDGEYDVGLLTDTGRFLVREGVALKGGDTVTITAMFGCRALALPAEVFPNVGDILLAPAGSPVATGYDNTVKPVQSADPADPMSGLDIIWLGSSVTYGAQSGGYYSMADAIAHRHAATRCEKYAISGTTLVNGESASYVNRMLTIDPHRTPDLFVVQLSTNDATSGKPYGAMTDSFDSADFDDTTIIGAMETIIAHVRAVFGCPVVFYTGSYYESEAYAVMVEALRKLREKWGFGVVDLWGREEMTALYGSELYGAYMSDPIHPKRRGYVEWWTPVFEECLPRFAAEKTAPADHAVKVVVCGKAADVKARYVDGRYDLERDALGQALEQDVSAVPVCQEGFCSLNDLVSRLPLCAGCHGDTLYLTAARQHEEPDEDAEVVIPARYTKRQTTTFEMLGLELLVAMDEAEHEFFISFRAFGFPQVISGTVDGGAVAVEYNKTGFFGREVGLMLASVKPDAWENC